MVMFLALVIIRFLPTNTVVADTFEFSEEEAIFGTIQISLSLKQGGMTLQQ